MHPQQLNYAAICAPISLDYNQQLHYQQQPQLYQQYYYQPITTLQQF